MTTLTLSDLTIGYARHTVASHLTASLRGGELTCLVGRNGTGKSTLLRTVAAFQPALSGTVTLEGDDGTRRDISRMSRAEVARAVSVVLTGRPDVALMTAREIVELGRSPYTGMWGTLRASDRRVVDEAVCRAGIADIAERRLATLSDGECQKVMIAKALAQETPVILLDEPTAFLDYPSKAATLSLMADIAHQGRAVLLSTHDMEMALRLADRLWVMTAGHRLCCGTRAELESVLTEEGLEGVRA